MKNRIGWAWVIGAMWVFGFAGIGSADTPGQHPVLRDGLYSITAQLKYEAEKNESAPAATPAPAPAPEYASMPLSVEVVTYLPGQTGVSGVGVPVHRQALNYVVTATGKMGIELPETVLGEGRQVLVISCKPGEALKYVAWLEQPIERGKVEQIKMPLEVKVEKARECEIVVRAVNEGDGKPVRALQMTMSRQAGNGDVRVSQYTDEKGEAKFKVMNTTGVRIYAEQLMALRDPPMVEVSREAMGAKMEPVILRIPEPAVRMRVMVEKEAGKREVFEGQAGQIMLAMDSMRRGIYGSIGRGQLLVYERLSPGKYAVKLMCSGYEDYYMAEGREVVVEEGAKWPIEQDLVLKACQPAELELTVVDEKTKQPIGGAQVSLRRGNKSEPGMKTDGSGVVKWPELRTGWFTVTVDVNGYSRVSRDIFIEGKTAEQVVMEGMWTLRVTVKDAEGKAVEKAEVVVLTDGRSGKSERHGRSDAQGVAVITNISGNAAMVLVTGKDGMSGRSMGIEYAGLVEKSEDAAVTATLGKTVAIKGVIAGAAGAEGMIFTTMQNGRHVPGAFGAISVDGAFDTAIMPGKYEVFVQLRSANKDRRMRYVGTVEVPAEGKTDIALSIPEGGEGMSREDMLWGDKR